MLKTNNQLEICLSSHALLFDILIEKNNFLTQLKDIVDFSFVYDELKYKYSYTMGRKEDVIEVEAECYYFNIEKCKHCKFKTGCYKEGAKFKTYSVKIKDDIHIKHMDYMETDEFKKLYDERYKCVHSFKNKFYIADHEFSLLCCKNKDIAKDFCIKI